MKICEASELPIRQINRIASKLQLRMTLGSDENIRNAMGKVLYQVIQ